MVRAEELENYFRIPADNRDLNYGKYFSEGEEKVSRWRIHSHNTFRLDMEGTKKLLMKLPVIRKDILEEDCSDIYEP